ncbi:hypothetical protein C1X43_34030, partial [Pseudomonas sp. GW460-C3]
PYGPKADKMLTIKRRCAAPRQSFTHIAGERPNIDGNTKHSIVPRSEGLMKRGVETAERTDPARRPIRDRLDTGPFAATKNDRFDLWSQRVDR